MKTTAKEVIVEAERRRCARNDPDRSIEAHLEYVVEVLLDYLVPAVTLNAGGKEYSWTAVADQTFRPVSPPPLTFGDGSPYARIEQACPRCGNQWDTNARELERRGRVDEIAALTAAIDGWHAGDLNGLRRDKLHRWVAAAARAFDEAVARDVAAVKAANSDAIVASNRTAASSCDATTAAIERQTSEIANLRVQLGQSLDRETQRLWEIDKLTRAIAKATDDNLAIRREVNALKANHPSWGESILARARETPPPVRTGYTDAGGTYHPAPDMTGFDLHVDAGCISCKLERENPASGYVGQPCQAPCGDPSCGAAGGSCKRGPAR